MTGLIVRSSMTLMRNYDNGMQMLCNTHTNKNQYSSKRVWSHVIRTSCRSKYNCRNSKIIPETKRKNIIFSKLFIHYHTIKLYVLHVRKTI